MNTENKTSQTTYPAISVEPVVTNRYFHELEQSEIDAVNYLYLTAGISEPTEQDNNWAMEAIVYANIDYWVDKPMTHKEYADRKIFEIKSLSYFMRKRNYNDLKTVRYFREYEHRELTNLQAMTSHPAFNYG